MSNKTPEMEAAINGITAKLFGRSRSEALKTATCVVCGEPAVDFEDELSLKEYSISGMCQTCQNRTFG